MNVEQRTFGGYRIVARLGKGGMGDVYLAEHALLRRQAAVKVLRAEHAANPELARRFLNEAKAAAGIGHPGIVEVLDCGITAAGAPYLVMELLQGESVETRLRRGGPFAEADAARIAAQAASALAAAHARGVVHRDLKPDHLFLVTDPERPGRERVKIVDFGLAKILARESGGAAPDGPGTRSGALLGTPAYMPPEQCGSAAQADARSDVYALGVVLFRMLTGRRPFEAANPERMMALHLHVEPPSPRDFARRVSAAMEAVVLRMLRKQPAERFDSMEEVRRTLEGPPWRARRPVARAPAPPPVPLDEKPTTKMAQASRAEAKPRARCYAPRAMAPESFFVPDGAAYVSTALTRGPWSVDHQHGGPPAALLARALERRLGDDGFDGEVVRFEAEFLRPIPIAQVTIACEVLRAGRQVRTLRATLHAGGTEIAAARALCIRRTQLELPARAAVAPPPLPAASAPFEFPFFEDPVGYQSAMEMRVAAGTFGGGALTAWMRMRVPLVPGEAPSPLQRVVVAADSGNGVSLALDPKRWTFLNPELTVYLHRPAEGEWVCLDARTIPSPSGVGIAESALFDAHGPIGRSLQSLVVAARAT
jgi:serine/threonine protein kinase